MNARSVAIPGVTYHLDENGDWHAPGHPPLLVNAGVRREAHEWPFAADTHWNTPFGSEADFGLDTDPEYVTEGILRVENSPYDGLPYGGLMACRAGAINNSTFTVAKNMARETDTTITVTVPTNGDFPPDIGRVWTGKAPSTVLLSAEWNQAGVNPDSEAYIIEPDGRTVHDFYKLMPVAGTPRSYTATRHRVYDLRGDGFAAYDPEKNDNIRAARFPTPAGLITHAEMASSDEYAIQHRLVLGLPGTCLLRKSADPTGKQYVYPAAGTDGHANDPLKGYFGRIPMGAVFGIPPHVSMPSGLSLDGRKLFHAAQDYGIVVGDIAGYGALYVTYGLSNQQVANLKADWQGPSKLNGIISMLRMVKNTSPVFPGAPGTPRRPPAPPFV